jgi:Tfp pilus assembly protein FimV
MEMFFGSGNYFCKVSHMCLYGTFESQFKKLKMQSQTSRKKQSQKRTQHLTANPPTRTQPTKPVPKVSISTQQPLKHNRHQHMSTPTLNKRKLRPR